MKKIEIKGYAPPKVSELFVRVITFRSHDETKIITANKTMLGISEGEQLEDTQPKSNEATSTVNNDIAGQ